MFCRFMFFLWMICLWALPLVGQNPKNWAVSEPALAAAPVDQEMEPLIQAIGKEEVSEKITILDNKVTKLYQIVGMKRTPIQSNSLFLKMRTLWHDLARVADCIGLNAEELARQSGNVPDNATGPQDGEALISDPIRAHRQINDRIHEFYKMLGM